MIYFTKKYFSKLLLIIISVFILSGCGYSLGTNANPQIKTIAIASIKNDTYEINVASTMKQALIDRFNFDGAYKIKNMYNADAVLYGRIKGIDVTAANILTAPGGVTTITKTFGISVNFEFTLIIPGRGQPVISPTSVSGSAQFQVPVDLFPARQEGLEQACRDAAEQVVWRCSEGW